MKAITRNPGAFGALGIFAAFAFAVVLAVAVLGDAAWTFGDNTLSDLGSSDVQMSADLFNYGCIVCGIIFAIVGLGKAVCELGANRASGCLLAISAVFLFLIGIVHNDFGNGNTHFIIAVLAFAFLAFSAIASAVGDEKDGFRLNAALTSILILVAIGYAIGSSMPAAEVVTVACAIVWIIGISAKMVFESRKG